MRALRPAPAVSSVTKLAEQRPVHRAFQWLHLHEQQIMRWQAEMVAIPAPPFGESARADWLLERFTELGLEQVRKDSIGNALGVYRATIGPGRLSRVLLSAHIDTVFPLETPIDPVIEGTRLTAPGACDNGAGVVAQLAIAAALRHGNIEVPCDLLFAGNVGEEGEGDLRGIRHIYKQTAEDNGPAIRAHLVLDGAGHELVVTGAVGSRRYLVTIEGSGGHAWSDAGRPNPIIAMSQAIERLSELRGVHSVGPDRDGESAAHEPETRWNVGTIMGGTSINSIPQSCSARFDMRSTEPEQLVLLEVELFRALEDAVSAANAMAAKLAARNSSGSGPKRWGVKQHSEKATGRDTDLRLSIEQIGARPAGRLPHDSKILRSLRAVDRHLGIHTQERIASTDANIPISLGVDALSIGAGGAGGGVHTTREWYDARDRALGLRRILLLILAIANDEAADLWPDKS